MIVGALQGADMNAVAYNHGPDRSSSDGLQVEEQFRLRIEMAMIEPQAQVTVSNPFKNLQLDDGDDLALVQVKPGYTPLSSPWAILHKRPSILLPCQSMERLPAVMDTLLSLHEFKRDLDCKLGSSEEEASDGAEHGEEVAWSGLGNDGYFKMRRKVGHPPKSQLQNQVVLPQTKYPLRSNVNSH